MQVILVFVLIVLSVLPLLRKRSERVLCILCATLALLVISSCALADGVSAVPVERMVLQMPRGMQASTQVSPGEMNVVIDTVKTDWGLALLESFDTSCVDVRMGITAPEQAKWYVSACGNGDEKDALDLLNSQVNDDCFDELSGDAFAFMNGSTVAQCVNEYRIIQSCSEELDLYVRWFDESWNEISTEKLHFTSAQTVSRGVYAPLYLISKEDILPNADNLSGVQSRTAPGEVVYTVGASSSKKNRRIVTGVRMPQGAVRCDWVSLYDGETPLNIQGGYALVETAYPNTGARKTTVGLKFYDANENLIHCGSLAIQYQTSEMKPWPAYLDGWESVPAECLSVAINGQSGISMPYEGGILSYDYSGIADDPELLRDCTAEVSVTPPDGAAYVRMNTSGGGEGLLGNHGNMDEVNEWINMCDPDTVSGQYTAFESQILNEINTYDGVTLFVPATPTQLDAGLVYYFYWYRNEEDVKENQPFAIWWFAEHSDPFVKTIVNPLQKTEGGLSSVFDGAVAIGDEGWSLVTEYYLQEGENAQHYELHLVDVNGNAVSPGRSMVVYLPYPEGCAYDDGTTYVLRHYDAGGVSESVTTLTPTEIGLRFEITSFSPFVLTWTSAPVQTATPTPSATPTPDVSHLPRTGDSTPIGWLIGTLALAAAGLWLALVRRHSA